MVIRAGLRRRLELLVWSPVSGDLRGQHHRVQRVRERCRLRVGQVRLGRVRHQVRQRRWLREHGLRLGRLLLVPVLGRHGQRVQVNVRRSSRRRHRSHRHPVPPHCALGLLLPPSQPEEHDAGLKARELYHQHTTPNLYTRN